MRALRLPRPHWAALLLGVVVLSGCGTATESADEWKAPPTGVTFDYQLGGEYDVPDSVRVVVRDRSDSPLSGRYNICYLNAFQTQPDGPGQSKSSPPYGTTAWWLSNYRQLVLTNGSGKPVIDEEWNEAVFDVSTSSKRAELLSVQKPWLEDCAKRGFNAVEPDNLDSYTRSDDAFDLQANVSYAALFTDYAHSLGLATGQKNTAELGTRGRADVGFDFAIAESCQQYDECGVYQKAYGAAVFDIEYTDDPTAAFDAACSEYGDQISVIRRDRDLVPNGSPGYFYSSC